MKNFDEIWGETMAPTLDQFNEPNSITNGLKEETAMLYVNAENLSDDEVLEKINKGEL